MAKSISWLVTAQYVQASGGTLADPVTFKDITDYFKANPIALNWDMPRKLGGAPWELCEGNASDWSGLNGLGTPVNDAVIFTKNSQSIKIPVTSQPTITKTITRIYYSGSGAFFNIYLNTTGLTAGDEIIIKGTANHNCISKIVSIQAGWIQAVIPAPLETFAEENTGTVSLIHTVGFNMNNTFYDYNTTNRAIGAGIADRFKFSLRTDGIGSPKLVAIGIRNGSTNASTTEINCIYGASYSCNIAITGAWQDFDIRIKDMAQLGAFRDNKGNNSRSYWSNTQRLYFHFEGLNNGENVWIDGVRFTCTNPNPRETGENSYITNVPLYILSCFKDYGFSLIFDMLSMYSRNMVNSGFYNYGAQGDIQVGDYSGTKKEGGNIYIDLAGVEDVAPFSILKTDCQGVNFVFGKNKFAAANIATATYCRFRNCNFTNLAGISSVANFTFENCSWSGGRYFMQFPGGGNEINGFTVYAVTLYQFYLRSSTAQLAFKGVKIIDSRAAQILIESDRYGTAGLTAGYTFINFDISECNNPRIRFSNSGTNFYPDIRFAFSFDLKVLDSLGNALSGCAVLIKDNAGNIITNVTTDVNGVIAQQAIEYYRGNNVNASNYFDTPANWIKYYPFTLSISKAGKQIYNTAFFNAYDRQSLIVRKGMVLELSLLNPSLQITSVDITDCSSPLASDGSLTVTAEGGTAPFEYSIDGVNWQLSDTFIGLSTATYNVSVRDADLTVTQMGGCGGGNYWKRYGNSRKRFYPIQSCRRQNKIQGCRRSHSFQSR